jgi:hypothetical protein
MNENEEIKSGIILMGSKNQFSIGTSTLIYLLDSQKL